MKKRFLVTLLFIFSFYIFALSVNAAILDTDTVQDMGAQGSAFADAAGFEKTADDGGIGNIIATIIKAFLSLLAIIFLVLMLYGGYLWMTARGNEEQVKKAKDLIQTAIIGLIIIVAAYSITYFVFRNLPGGGGGGPGHW